MENKDKKPLISQGVEYTQIPSSSELPPIDFRAMIKKDHRTLMERMKDRLQANADKLLKETQESQKALEALEKKVIDEFGEEEGREILEKLKEEMPEYRKAKKLRKF